MDDSLGCDGRGAKRIKLSPREFCHSSESLYHQQAPHPPQPKSYHHAQHTAPVTCSDPLQQSQQPMTYPLSDQFPPHPDGLLSAMDAWPEIFPWSNDTVFDPSWNPHVGAPGSAHEANAVAGPVFPLTPLSPVSIGSQSPATAVATPWVKPAAPQHDCSLTSPYPSQSTQSDSPCHLRPIQRDPRLRSCSSTAFKPAFKGNNHQVAQNSEAPGNYALESPFKDCVGTFGLYKSSPLQRPTDGKVNGYIKVSWPTDRRGSLSTKGSILPVPDGTQTVETDASTGKEGVISHSSLALIEIPAALSRSEDGKFEFAIDLSDFFNQPVVMTSGVVPFNPSPLASHPTDVADTGAPQLLPSQFGYEAKMDDTDRRFWMFYIRNWCPGRSVLQGTNLWLKDFAPMHKSSGVLSAIQSLAGIYIYDYMPLESIRVRINRLFADAEKRFTLLLNDPETARNEMQANEFITIAAILSMQDIILTERRLKRSLSPRWLEGFRRGEQILEATDHGSRFWKASNVQPSSLRLSQAIIVGRAVILAQPMSSLPLPHRFDAQKEASRFGWLLYGTEKDMYEIHGGCGFSKKLLHVLSQTTYCAARLQQESESPIVPMTANYLYDELLNMRQWSPESKTWEAAQSGALVIDWVRTQAEDFQINTNASMTDVTAEAWRFAAILYLQCRVFRWPRNHPEVVFTLDDLARCITIMPTSGSQFTAQAPLFPVFLLGVLATVSEHRAISKNWFDEVLRTPVRSSVPPLYTALQRIWEWIDREVPLPYPPNIETDQPIYLRRPWWEKLVLQVQQQEQEIPCLT